MNNYFFSLLFTLFFFCGITLHANTDGGQTEYIIVITKTGEPLCSFEIPEKYLDSEGDLLVPFTLSLHNNNKQQLYITESRETRIVLPISKAEYTLVLNIGDYETTCIEK